MRTGSVRVGAARLGPSGYPALTGGELVDLSDSVSVIGVFGHARASRLAARGLRGLAHRGGRAAGLVAFDDAGRSRQSASVGFLEDEAALDALRGDVALGLRHGHPQAPDVVAGSVDAAREPAWGTLSVGQVAVAFSGTVVGAASLRRDLLAGGALLDGDGLSALVLGLIARSGQRTLVNRVVDALWKASGAFAVVVAAPGMLVGVRDPQGLRPLALGRVDGAIVLASEEAAFVAAGGHLLRAVEPGEMVIVDERGVSSVRPFARRPVAACGQELLQIALSGSHADGRSVWEVRRQLGEELARESKPTPDAIIVAADDAAHPAALGYAATADRPIAQPWVPGALRAVPEVVAGRRVVLVSLSAGSGLRARVSALLTAGASEVHVRCTAPRRTQVCPYGVLGEDVVVDPADTWAARLGASGAAALGVERARNVLRVAIKDAPAPCLGCVGDAWPLKDVFEDDTPSLFGEP